jgi:elongation factor 1-alpha
MEPPLETIITVAVGGSADSGKSTLIGVTTTGIYDDGNGSASKTVAVHPHEITNRRTSSISTRIYPVNDNQAVTLVDLCGQSKYFGTTSYGISGYFPDYAFVLVSANRGVLVMTKQHIRLLMSFGIPIIFVITHIDLIKEDNKRIYEETKSGIANICCSYVGRTSPSSVVSFVNNYEDQQISDQEIINIKENGAVENILDCLRTNSNGKQMLFPVITISNKTGFFFNAIRKLLTRLTPRLFWSEDSNITKMFLMKIPPSISLSPKISFTGSVFYIDSAYNPLGIGLVACGILRGDPITKNDNVIIGPFGREFIDVKVRSIHNNARQSILQLKDHHRGCIAFTTKKAEITRSQIKSGVIILNSYDLIAKICFKFRAAIIVFTGKTTIKSGYVPVLHLATIKQPVRLHIDPTENEGRDTVISNTIAIVSLKFLFRPEFIEPYNIFVFRNGTIEGIGMVLQTYSIVEDMVSKPEIIKITKRRTIKS